MGLGVDCVRLCCLCAVEALVGGFKTRAHSNPIIINNSDSNNVIKREACDFIVQASNVGVCWGGSRAY